MENSLGLTRGTILITAGLGGHRAGLDCTDGRGAAGGGGGTVTFWGCDEPRTIGHILHELQLDGFHAARLSLLI